MAAKKQPAPKLETIGASDLNKLVAEDTGLAIGDVRKVTKALAAICGQAVAEGYQVNLFGIVKLSFAHTAAKPRRKGDNPLTGETNVWFKATPEKLRLTARALSGVTNHVPTTKSRPGKALVQHFADLREYREKQRASRERAAKRAAKAA